MLKLKTVEWSYTVGEEHFTVSTLHDVATPYATLRIRTEGDVFTAGIRAKAPIVLESLRAVFEQDYPRNARIFLNGYQSWTDSTEHGIHDTMRGLSAVPRNLSEKYAFPQYGDYTFAQYRPLRRGAMHGFTYGYVREETVYSFAGSLGERSGFTCLYTDTQEGTLTFEKDCKGLTVSDSFEGLHLLLCEGAEQTVFDRYFSMLGTRLRPEAHPLYGYTSWYRHYQNISDEILLHDLEAMQQAGHTPDVFQIDDGYQTAVGDWLHIDPHKFRDMAALAQKIRQAGMLPGLWLAPFAAESDSELCLLHRDWLVRDENGELLRGGSNWSGFYVLDLYNEQVRSYLREVFDTVIRKWGFGLVKLDFLYAVCLQPRPDKTRGRIMADAMDFLRECCGDAFILGCGVPLGSAFGKVDYCRIGCDVSLDWNDKPHMRLMHRERVSTRNTILNTVFRRQLSGRAFLNDPDVFLLRSDGNSMTAEQRRTLGEINALCGDVLFTSDDLSGYTDEQKKLLDRMHRMRDARILTADMTGSTLTLEMDYHGKYILRAYEMS